MKLKHPADWPEPWRTGVLALILVGLACLLVATAGAQHERIPRPAELDALAEAHTLCQIEVERRAIEAWRAQ